MTERNVGDLGEDTLAFWCSQTGIIATRPQRDRKGWDYLLEFPPDHASSDGPTVSRDKSPAPLKCWVQVKSTDKHPRSWPVKLDNWERLVKDPLPAFFLVLEFDGKPDCQRAFLIHVEESYTELVLKELRRRTVTGIEASAKDSLRFKFSKANKLAEPNGNALEEAIRHCVGNDLARYSAQKLKLIEAIGYDENRYSFEFTVVIPEDVESPQEHLIDFALGLTPFLETSTGKIFETRFDIQLPEHSLIQNTVGRLEIMDIKPSRSAIIRFSSPGVSKELPLRMDLIAPRGFGAVVSPEFLKIRLLAPCLEMIFRPTQAGTCPLTFRIPITDEEFKLSDLNHVAELISFLHDASDRGENVYFEILVDRTSVGRGEIPSGVDIGEETMRIIKAISLASNVVGNLSLNDQLDVKPVELYNQFNRLLLMNAGLGEETLRLKVGFWSDNFSCKDDEQIIVPFVISALIGQYQIAMSMALFGVPFLTGSSEGSAVQVEMIAQEIRLEKTYVRFRGTEDPIHLDTLTQDIVAKYSANNQVVVLE